MVAAGVQPVVFVFRLPGATLPVCRPVVKEAKAGRPLFLWQSAPQNVGATLLHLFIPYI